MFVKQTKLKTKSFKTMPAQCAKKGVSDGPGLVDFAIRLEKSVFNLPDG